MRYGTLEAYAGRCMGVLAIVAQVQSYTTSVVRYLARFSILPIDGRSTIYSVRL